MSRTRGLKRDLLSRGGLLLACSLLMAALLTLPSCSKSLGEEDKVRAVVEAVAEAARARDIKGIMKHISTNYSDDAGNDYKALKGMLFYQFMRAQKVSVFVRNIDVEVQQDRALVNTRVLVVLGKEVETIDDVLPEDAAGLKFSVVFEKVSGRWKALSASWDNVGMIGII